MVHNVTGYSVTAHFATRREAELAVEHLVQEHRIDRKSITIEAGGDANTAGMRPAGADVQSGHPGLPRHGAPALHGMIEVRVACQPGQAHTIEATLKEAGAR